MATHISIPLGIIIGLLASFVQSLGLTIQRKSHVLNQNLPEHKQTVEHRRPLWLLGFAIFISSNILGSLVQIASLPVVILAPLGAVSLLWNAFFARFILGDVFSPWMILGTILIAGGAILIAIFGIVPEQTRSLDDLLQLFSRPAFVVYFSCLGFIVVVCLVATHITDFSLARKVAKAAPPVGSPVPSPLSISATLRNDPSTLTTGITDAIAEAVPNEGTPLLDRKAHSSPSLATIDTNLDGQELLSLNRTRLLLAISYASFSGIISGMCLLFAKSGVELLLLTLRGQNQFWRWQSWMLVTGLVIFALLQLWYLHKALILADPTMVCPSAFCFYNVSSIVNGLVYFNQFALISALHLGLVGLGMVILLGGVWVVSIQSGGRVVGVGTWNEGDNPDNLTDLSPASEDLEGQVALSDSGDTSVSQEQSGPVRMERDTVSESNIPKLSASQEEYDAGLSHASASSHSNNHPSTVFEGRTRPSTGRRTTTDPRHPSASTHLSHFRTISHPHSHGHGYSNPISPPLSTVATGFQIGLSPLSPGFTIVPVERRRRISGLGSGFADVVREAGEVERRKERERRRTVSEGDLSRGMGLLGNDVNEVPRRDREASREEVVIDGENGITNAGSEGSRRWKWLRKLFTKRD